MTRQNIGTIAAVNKIKEERPDLKILFGSLNEDVYEMAKVGDIMLTIDPELYGESVAQMAVDAGAKLFYFLQLCASHEQFHEGSLSGIHEEGL